MPANLDALLQRLPPEFVASLKDHAANPVLRLNSQLRQLNRVRRLRYGEVPIASFLDALIECTPDSKASKKLEELVGKVNRCDPPAPLGVEPDVSLEWTASATVVIPHGSTFCHAATVMAKVDKKSVALSGFSAEEKSTKIRRVDIAVANATEGLLALRDYVPKGSVRRYSVKTEGARLVLMIEETP